MSVEAVCFTAKRFIVVMGRHRKHLMSLAMMLAHRADHSMTIKATVGSLGESIGVCNGTVRAGLRALEAEGWLVCAKRSLGGKPSEYFIDIALNKRRPLLRQNGAIDADQRLASDELDEQ